MRNQKQTHKTCFRKSVEFAGKWGSQNKFGMIKNGSDTERKIFPLLWQLVAPRWQPMCYVLHCEFLVISADSWRWRKWPEIHLQLRFYKHDGLTFIPEESAKDGEIATAGNRHHHGPASTDEHLPSMWHECERLMGVKGHGRLVPGWSRSFCWCSTFLQAPHETILEKNPHFSSHKPLFGFILWRELFVFLSLFLPIMLICAFKAAKSQCWLKVENLLCAWKLSFSFARAFRVQADNSKH